MPGEIIRRQMQQEWRKKPGKDTQQAAAEKMIKTKR